MRSTFGVKLNGLVDSIEQLLLLQFALHQVHCGTHQSPEETIHLFEHGALYPQLDVAADAREIFDAVAATDACDPQECSLKLHYCTWFLPGIVSPKESYGGCIGPTQEIC